MAAVYEEISLEWGGKAYTITPTYRMIQVIEQKISLAGLLQRVLSNDPPFSQIADLFAILLELAGCEDADAEDLHLALWSAKDTSLLESARKVLLALMPARSLTGNDLAPKGAKKGKGKKHGKKARSSGASTTGSRSDTTGSSLANSGK